MIYSLLLAKGGLFDPIAKPLAAVLAFFYDLVPNYGIAIVLLTIAMMIVLTPLTIKQTRSMLVMQKLQPEMKKLQEQHKNDRQALNEAVMALYKEHNASPLGGCLPMLLPFPLFIALLRVLEGLSHTVTTTVNGHKVVTAVPKYLTTNTKMAKDIVKAGGKLDAFGMNLAKSARNVGGGFGHTLPYFVLLLVMVGTQFYQQYQLTSKNPAAKSQPGQAAMMKFIPLFFGLISLNFPAGVVIYWTVSNIIRIGQQWALYSYDPKVKALVAKDVKEIEAKTREIESKTTTSGRSRFRDLLSNASEAAADRKNLKGGKGGAKPAGGAAGGKAQTPARGGRTQPGKGAGASPGAKSQRPGSAPAKAGGAAKALPQKPGPGKGSNQKAGGSNQKAPPPRPNGAKSTTPRPSDTPVARSGLEKGAPPKVAATAKNSLVPDTSDTNQDKVPQKAPDGAPDKAPAKASPGSARPDTTSAAPSASEGTSSVATNGSTKAPVVTSDSNGADSNGSDQNGSDSNGSDRSASRSGNGSGDTGPAEVGDDAAAGVVAGAGAPAKGRTGGGSARNVSSRRRRKGR